MRANASIILACCLPLVSLGCQTHNYAGRGATLGGLTGGGIGAILGEATNDEPLLGAAIGSAVGILAGNAVGSGLDELDAAQQAQVQQAAYQQHASHISLHEVVEMSRAGLSDDIITRHIETNGFGSQLDARDLIALREQGVSDTIIRRLQTASAVRMVAAQAPVREPVPRVIVEEYHAGPRLPHYPRYRYRGGPRCPPPRYHGPDLHWGVSFGH